MQGISKSDLDSLKQQMDMCGYAVLPGFLTEGEVIQLRDAFMDAAKGGPVPGLSDLIQDPVPGDPLARYPRMMHPHNHPEYEAGRLSHKYLIDQRIRAVIEALLGEEAAAAQSMFYFKPPGARGQELHQDNFYLRVRPGTCMAAWIAVDDVDAQNGGMKVVAGSQKMDIFCPEQADSATSFTSEFVRVPDGLSAEHVNLKAGDVLFFNGSVIHGSTPNTSKDRFRRSLIFHYVPKASAELSTWYSAIDFSGVPVNIPAATGGGPCGTVAATGPH